MTDKLGLTRDRLTTKKTASITLNAGGTRYTFQVPVGEIGRVHAADPGLVADLGRIVTPAACCTGPWTAWAARATPRSTGSSPRRWCVRATWRRCARSSPTAAAPAATSPSAPGGTSLSGQAVSDDILVELAPFWTAARVLDGGRRDLVAAGSGGRPPEPMLWRPSPRASAPTPRPSTRP